MQIGLTSYLTVRGRRQYEVVFQEVENSPIQFRLSREWLCNPTMVRINFYHYFATTVCYGVLPSHNLEQVSQKSPSAPRSGHTIPTPNILLFS